MKRVALSAVLLLTACGATPVPPPDPAPARVVQHEVGHTDAVATSAPTATPVAEEPKTPDLPAPSDVATPPADAAKTASGLATKVLTPGTGKDHPGPDDQLEVHYSGWTASGRMFDSSVTRNEPL